MLFPGGNTGPIPEPSRALAYSTETPGSSITEAEIAVCLLPHRAGLDTPTHSQWQVLSPTGSDSHPVCGLHFSLCDRNNRKKITALSMFVPGRD